MTDRPYGDEYGKALAFAAERHARQTRKNTGIPYVSHLLAVSALVWEDGGDETEATAGLLHDAVEDRCATIDEIRAGFGDDVARIVEHCSDAEPENDEAKAPWFDRKVDHLDHLATLTARPDEAGTIRVLTADKLANVRSMLADHRAGEAVFSRFKSGLGGTVWYQRSMHEIVARARPDAKLTGEFGRAVDELASIMDDLAAPLAADIDRLTAALGDTLIRGDRDATRHLAFELARAAAAGPGETREGAVAGVILGWLGHRPKGRDATRGDLDHDQLTLLDSVLHELDRA